MDGFHEGYEFFQKSSGVTLGALSGNSYIEHVNTEIDKLSEHLSQYKNTTKDPKILKGDVAEFWHSGTFNINAAVNNSNNRATSLKSNGLGSIDVLLDSGEKYGSKYDATAAKSLHEQAKSFYERYKEYASGCIRSGRQVPSYEEYIQARSNELRANGIDPEHILPHDPLYGGQFRLVSSDQYNAIKEQLLHNIAKEQDNRPELVKRYQDTLDMLRDHIEDSDGNQSIRLSKQEAEMLAKAAKEGGFDPSDWDLTTEQLISYNHVLSQAFQAGMSAATISMVLKVAPEIIKAIDFLIKNGVVDAQQFKQIGFAALSGGAEGFVRGSVSAAITTACKAGLWGEAMKSVNPTIVGTITVITMDTMKNAYSVAIGKMSRRELTDELVREMFISSCSLLVGSTIQGIMIELPVVGFMIGSFIGSVLGSFTYSVGYNAVISFCVDTGFTMFGLVDQDYQLPESIMKQIGLEVFEYEKFQYAKFEPNRFEAPKFELNRFDPPSFDITFLRRGVIGIRQIGYV